MSTGKKILKWIGIALGSLLLLIALMAAFFFIKAGSVFHKTFTYEIKTPVYVPSDSASIARGERLSNVLCACIECHGRDYGGKLFIDGMPFALIWGPNLTFGKGGFDQNNYSVADFDRAVRHGIRKDGRGLFVMPANHYTYLSDADLAAIYSYIRSLPPVDREVPPFTLGPIGKIVVATGGLVTSATAINHDGKRPSSVPIGPTAEYGKYITQISCVGCHGPNLSGGKVYDGDPDWPPAKNITRGGVLPRYTEETFTKLLRTGIRYDGTKVDSTAMPIAYTNLASDEEIHALWSYLQTAPSADSASVTWYEFRAP